MLPLKKKKLNSLLTYTLSSVALKNKKIKKLFLAEVEIVQTWALGKANSVRPPMDLVS